MFSWESIRDNKVFWPVLILVLLLLVNLIFTPGFFKITMRDGHLFGNLIDILNRGSIVALLAIGMTMVMATGGIDLSVGAVIAISAATAAVMINPYQTLTTLDSSDVLTQDRTYFALPLVIIGPILLATLFGIWNGLLVTRINIQAMVATLILMVAGRGIAQLITNGEIITIYYSKFFYVGNGFLFTLPFTFFIVLAVLLLAWLMTRRTSLGLFIESVGINSTASFYSGINEKNVKLLTYAFCGFCAGIGGLIYSANVQSADANNAGLWTELDAILAAVFGGTSLMGGRFSLVASVIGAYIIQAIDTTMYAMGVPAQAAKAIKGLVVLIVVIIYSEQVRTAIGKLFGGRTAPAGEGA